MTARVARLVIAPLVALALGLAALVAALQPPHFDVPERGRWQLRDVTLVEPGRAPRAVRLLRVEAGVITHIDEGPAIRNASARSWTGDARDASDLAGLYVTPGLSDLHVHYPPRVAVGNTELWSLLLLAHGVTSIRETGSIDGSIFDVREDIRSGRLPGPRIFACGPMLDGERPSFPSNRVVATREQARAAVAEIAAAGADCIKAYNMLSPEALAGLRAAAAEAGLPVIGHAPHAVSLEDAGLVDLQHGTGTVVVDVERVGRQDFRNADWVTVDDARIAHVARVSLDQGIAHTPTLVNARMRRLLAADEPGAVRRAVASDTGLRHLPRFWVPVWRNLWGAPFVAGDAESEAREALFRERQAWMTARLHEAGAAIHAGTDTLMPFVAPGSSLHGELAELVAAGLAPNDVWAIATREAGRSLGVPQLGTIAVGAPADLLFLRADPSEGGVAALREIEAVMAEGRLYRRADLEAMLARADAHFQGRFYEAVMGVVVAALQGGFAPEGPEPVREGGGG